MASFTGLNAQVLGISVDHVPCLKAWAESLGGIHYPLLSDFWPHGAAAELFGVMRPEDGFSERAIFVLDKKGVIRYIDIHAIDDKPDNEEVRKVLRLLEAEDAALPVSPGNAEASSTSVVYPGDAEEEATPGGEIVLYCTRWCKDCRKAKAWLDERGLTYAEVDIDYNLAARSQVRKWGDGFLITPVIDWGGTIIVDFDVLKLEQALRDHPRLGS
jgi:glutaredoxin